MPRRFVCLYPCEKSFDDEASLRKHYQLVPACKWRWKQRERQATEEFERASERRRAEMRRNYAVDDGEMVDHSGWDLASNDADNTSHPERQSDNGPGSTGPLDHSRASDEPDLAATADFEELLYGPIQGDVTAEGNDDPYLDISDVMDIEEGPSDYVHTSDDIEQLGDILEGVQLGQEGAEDEELDPSSVESFPHAGEIKDPETRTRSHFETLYEETHGNPFHPFRDAAEFELVKWLNDMPLSKVDLFLQLDWVSHVYWLPAISYLPRCYRCAITVARRLEVERPCENRWINYRHPECRGRMLRFILALEPPRHLSTFAIAILYRLSNLYWTAQR
jgi:hypothetical protein